MADRPDCDVAVVGGGIGGAALAQALAARGVGVVVLERETSFKDHDAFGAITEMNLPFVTQARSGRHFYNAFNMELSRAHVAPVAAQLSVVDPSSGGFPECARSFAPLRAGHAARLPGAFRVWCSWSMTNPLDSERIRRSAIAENWLGRTY